MLGKLIKHEFRATGRVMLPVIGILLLLAALANISVMFIESTNSGFIEAVFGLILTAFFLMAFATMIIAMITMINRFYKNFLKDEGYLMHTLPVNVHGLVWSKLIVSFITMLLTGIIVFLVMMLTVFNLAGIALAEFSQIPSLCEFIAQLVEASGLTSGNIWLMIIEAVVMIVVSGLIGCLMLYASMAIGFTASNKKIMFSVIAFMVISIIFEILGLAFGYSVGNTRVFETDTVYQVFWSIQTISLSVLGYLLAQGAILYVATTWCLKKKLNLE